MNRFIVDRYKSINISTPKGEENSHDVNENQRKKKKEIERNGTKWQPRPPHPNDLLLSSFSGFKNLIGEIKRSIQVFLENPSLYQELGIEAPRGFLIFGPTGAGKTSLARAIGATFGLSLIEVPSTEIVSGISGESEANIRAIFEAAQKYTPSLIFLDEIDIICGRREASQKELERRIVSQLMASLDSITPGQIIVIGATSRPELIDPSLRRAGRFDKEIHIGLPDEENRKQLFQALLNPSVLADDVDFNFLARNTPGFAPADIKALFREAGHKAVERSYLNGDNMTIPLNGDPASLSVPKISVVDFKAALLLVQPTAKREGFTLIPDCTWDSIGALEEVRQELRMAVVEPLRHPELFARVGIISPSGVLLWGPPGCGKTMLAKAVANETHSNFISVKGPELLNKYVGESERALRAIFERARISAPCIIFFDELESLCSHRSDAGESYSARLVNQFLTEMDGLESRRGVYIIGATNKPDMIDAAMLRPGRLDKHVYVQLPTQQERYQILCKIANKTPLDPDVDLIKISQQCVGYSGADLFNLVRIASEQAIRPFLGMTDRGGYILTEIYVQMKCFEQALLSVRPSVTEYDRMEYDKLAHDFRASR